MRFIRWIGRNLLKLAVFAINLTLVWLVLWVAFQLRLINTGTYIWRELFYASVVIYVLRWFGWWLNKGILNTARLTIARRMRGTLVAYVTTSLGTITYDHWRTQFEFAPWFSVILVMAVCVPLYIRLPRIALNRQQLGDRWRRFKLRHLTP